MFNFTYLYDQDQNTDYSAPINTGQELKMSYDNAINTERIKNQMKNKTLGIVMNCVLPGTGHMYSGSPIKGVIVMAVFIACMVTSFLIAPPFYRVLPLAMGHVLCKQRDHCF